MLIRYVPTLLTWIDLTNNKGRLLQVLKNISNIFDVPLLPFQFNDAQPCHQNTVIEKCKNVYLII